ncbi:hypothetical protein OA92_21360 [Marinomonas sp. SBI22]|uniref:hypothetical protein n=1 Tax=unclassified Marinomonas TaxID=196814 RepID=UPI0007AF163C|nr:MULTISPECIES: hypothetical protein [unclassified Marinomonas]KZM39143.1 hypothetical protein OA92_21360 [Marinomonas sp. SBI22]KZM39927.1 hypothetical protein OA91_21215 [Marinomonas sp. SBI8L]
MTYIDFAQSIKNKTLPELTLEELAFAHLNGTSFISIKGGILYSNLTLVIKEIRHAKGFVNSKSFLPLAAAFTVLDQLGFCYSRNDIAPFSNPNASAIKKSLYYFCGFRENDKDTKAFYALRNSFLHTSSCLSKAKNKRQPNYCFIFDDEAELLITYPDKEWDGEFLTFEPKLMSTVVNRKMLIGLIQDAVKNALNCLYEGKLLVHCDDKEPEFYYRFLRFSEFDC